MIGNDAEHLFESPHDLCCLLSVRTGANLQVDVRFGNSQVLKKGAGHSLVVMLPSMDNDFPHDLKIRMRTRQSLLIVLPNGRDQRGCLHEIGPGSDYNHDFHLYTPIEQRPARSSRRILASGMFGAPPGKSIQQPAELIRAASKQDFEPTTRFGGIAPGQEGNAITQQTSRLTRSDAPPHNASGGVFHVEGEFVVLDPAQSLENPGS